MRILVVVIALLVGGILLGASVRTSPPPDQVQREVATRLEPVLALMDDLGVLGWNDCNGCQPIELVPGAATTDGTTTAWSRIATAVDGIVPGARITGISTIRDAADPAGRAVGFTATPRVLWGMDATWDAWAWTWHATPPLDAKLVAPGWTFRTISRGEG